MKKKKGLIWNFQNLYTFTLSKYLQENYDCVLYSIYDVPDNLKKTFQEQSVVKYEKSWYFFDHIKNVQREPDLEYLKSIEKKYGIKLWLLAINERFFYQFNYYRFSSNEVLLILEQTCKLFEKILNEIKPDFVIIEQPFFSYQQIFYEICKNQNVNVLILNSNRFNNGFYISSEIDRFDDRKISMKDSGKSRTKEQLLEYIENKTLIKTTNFQKSQVLTSRSESIRGFFNFIFSNNSNTKTHFTYYGRTKFKVILNKIIIEIQTKYRKGFYEKNSIKEIKDGAKFIFYPFSIDMESSLLMWTPFYTNQLELVKNIARSLPVGYELYVKEHPFSYTRGWRNISYYKELLSLPNVKLISTELNPKEIIKKSSLVIGVTSTAVLEAAFYGKSSITFHENIFSDLSSVFRLENMEELPNTIRNALQTEVDTNELSNFVNTVEQNSFQFNLSQFIADVNNYFFHNGSFVDVQIPTNKIETFVEMQRDNFSLITSEYIKKIESP